MKIVSLILLLVCVSCATRTPVTDSLARREKPVRIQNVPVIAQDDYHCGPATLAMVMQFHGKNVSAEEAAKGLFHKKLKGSFFPEMKGRARAEDFVVLEVNDLRKAFAEVRAGNPVIVLQNNGMQFIPNWHFSVLVGMDFDGPDVILHNGEKSRERMDMRLFERSFVLGGRRSLVLLPPEKLAATASELEHVEAVAILESMGKIEAANLAYKTILSRWPESELAILGLSNTYYALGLKDKARQTLAGAKAKSAIIWHNLAFLEHESGNKIAAKRSAREALSLSSDTQKDRMSASLQKFLR